MQNKKNTRIIHWLLLFAIILLAFFLRVYNIENAPAGVYPDEAVNGADAIRANETGNYLMFYPDNNGREGLFMNLIAFSFQFFGVTVLGLKFPSIVIGTLTVLGVFLLTKELFRGSWRAGLIASYLTAVSFWAINFSRIAFRANMLPFVLVFSFYFLFRGLRTKKYADFVFSGLIFGLGAHTYISFRIAPAILMAFLTILIITKKDFLQNYWKQSIVFIFAILLAASPILATFIQHPEYLESRSASISILSPEVNQGHLLKTLTETIILSLAKYNFWGDQNWRHNYPPYPVLHPAVGILFLVGLIYVLAKFFHLLFLRFRHKIRDEKLYIYLFLLSWFFFMLVPEFMTREGLPHALRSIGTLPVVYIFATLPLLWLLGKKEKFSPALRSAIIPLIFCVLIFIGMFNAVKYHIFWANNPKQHGAFNANLMRISDYIHTLSPGVKKIILVESMERIPIKVFNHKTANIHYVYPGEIDHFLQETALGENFLFILTERNENLLTKIQQKYPQLNPVETKDRFNNSFFILSNP